MLAHHSDVLAHGGTGPNFYRAYYQAHPEAGTLQGGGTAGGLGLDEEFVESALVAGAWVKAWLGVEALAADLLRIAPSLPAALTEMGARHIVYRGSVLQLRVAHGEIDLRGSSIGGAGRVRLVFRGPFSQQAELLRNGQADSGEVRHEGGALIADTTLAADLFTVFDPGEPEPDGGDPEPDGGGGDTGPGPDGGNLADGVETDDSRRGDSTGQVGDSEAATMITQGCGCFNADPHLVVLWLVPLLLWRRRSSAGRGENVVLCHARRLLH